MQFETEVSKVSQSKHTAEVNFDIARENSSENYWFLSKLPLDKLKELNLFVGDKVRIIVTKVLESEIV